MAYGANLQIGTIHAPSEARANSVIEIKAAITNERPGAWPFQAELEWWDQGAWQYQYIDFKRIDFESYEYWRWQWRMPDHDTDLYVHGYWWNYDTQSWVWDAVEGPRTVALAAPTSGYFSKPNALHAILTSGWINLRKGSWASIFGVDIPPFDLAFGDAVEGAIDWVVDKLNWLKGLVDTALSAAWGAASNAATAVTKIDDWIAGAGQWVLTQITGWWSGVWDPLNRWIQSWIDWLAGQVFALWDSIDARISELWDAIPDLDDWLHDIAWRLPQIEPFPTLIGQVQTVYEFVGNVGEEIVAFVSNPIDWILDRINAWLNEEV